MLADNDRLLAAEREQSDAMAELQVHESSYNLAVVAKTIHKERVDGLRETLKAEFLRAGNSAAAAETYAMADPRFHAGFKKIKADLLAAVSAITRENLLHEKLNCAREVMANERKRMGL